MNDEELKRFLHGSLGGRRVPDGVRARIFARLTRPSWVGAARVAALAAVVLTGAGILAWRISARPPLPRAIELAFEGHAKSETHLHAAASSTVREIASLVSDATGRAVQLPCLRDHGFVQMEAHRCSDTGTAHVVYANSWLKVSCFIYDADAFPWAGGRPIANTQIEGRSFARGTSEAVAIREGGIVKLWVSDLRLDQLSAIAVGAEEKRYQVATMVLSTSDAAAARPMGAVLSGMPGVEDVQLETGRNECHVKYDPRTVTLEGIIAVLETSGIEASATGK